MTCGSIFTPEPSPTPSRGTPGTRRLPGRSRGRPPRCARSLPGREGPRRSPRGLNVADDVTTEFAYRIGGRQRGHAGHAASLEAHDPLARRVEPPAVPVRGRRCNDAVIRQPHDAQLVADAPESRAAVDLPAPLCPTTTMAPSSVDRGSVQEHAVFGGKRGGQRQPEQDLDVADVASAFDEPGAGRRIQQPVAGPIEKAAVPVGPRSPARSRVDPAAGTRPRPRIPGGGCGRHHRRPWRSRRRTPELPRWPLAVPRRSTGRRR